METIASEIGKIGVYVAVLTFIVMTIKLIVQRAVQDSSALISVATLQSVVKFIIIAITVIVVAVPEGLPLAVTISLAFSVMKMKEENNLVRKLEASETMGGATQICTDKTGTLTQNKMSVKAIYLNDQVVEGRQADKFNALQSAQLLTEGVLFNCSARVEKNLFGVFEPKGNVTEQGMIRFLQDMGVKAHDVIRQKEDRIEVFIPFNSGRKRACTALRHPTKADTVRVFVKGAPEMVIELCDRYFDANGQEKELNHSKKEQIVNGIVRDSFAVKAYRTILIAYTDLST